MLARIVVVIRCAALALVGVLAAWPAWGDAPAEVLTEIARCSAIDDGGERLRCFDRAAPRAKQALVPKPEDFGKPAPPPPEVSQVTATVRELFKTPRGRTLFVLDNGQTWRQLDADDAEVLEPPPGQALRVMITRGLFGSYNLTIEGRNGLIKVRRIE